MKAAIREEYGKLELREVPQPDLVDDGVLVRVRATSINRGDWYTLIGEPLILRAKLGLRKPKSALLGGDFAGLVEAVGTDVAGIEPGDEVYGVRTGAFAEYAVPRVAVARKPANLSFEEAAAVPVAGLTALQGLRRGGLAPGQRVLINGASGGVGTFAVQIAKALGAGHVTAVCSTRNVEQARELGADAVIDYTREDFTRADRKYDLLFDNAGARSWRESTRALTPHGTLVLVGARMKNRYVSPFGHMIGVKLGSAVGKQNGVTFLARPNRPDLELLRQWSEEERVRPVIERRYAFAEIEEALCAIGQGHARGKLVVTM